MKGNRLFCIIILMLFLSSSTASIGAQSDKKDLMFNDLQFLEMATGNCAWKIAASSIAIKQAASQDVKNYGARMIKDHGQIGSELKGYAERSGITIYDKMDTTKTNTLNFLANEYGAAFDRQYMSLMMDDNQKDADLYRTESNTGKDKDIRGFAARIGKIMEEYVRMAEKILLDLPKPLLK